MLAVTLMQLLCRILNKLTPEKFDKLSLELLNVGIDCQTVLKGIILLVRLRGTYFLCCYLLLLLL